MDPKPPENSENQSSKSLNPLQKLGSTLANHAKDVLNQTTDVIIASVNGSEAPQKEAESGIKTEASDIISDTTAATESAVSLEKSGTIPENALDTLKSVQGLPSVSFGSPADDESGLSLEKSNDFPGAASETPAQGLESSLQGGPSSISMEANSASSSSAAPNPADSTMPSNSIGSGNSTDGVTSSTTNQSKESVFVFMNSATEAAQSPQPLPDEKSSNAGWIAAVVVVLLLFVAIGGFLVLNAKGMLGGDKPKPEQVAVTAASAPPKQPMPPKQKMPVTEPVASMVVIPPPATDLADIPRSDVIQDLISLQLVPVTDHKFKPMENISRGEYVTWLVRTWNRSHPLSDNLQLVGAQTPKFPDVTDANPAFKYIQMLASTGYLYGYTDGTFKPNQAITREEMLYMASIIHKLNRQDANEADYYYNVLKKRYLDGEQADPKYAFSITDHGDRFHYIWGKTEFLKPKEMVKRFEAALSLNTVDQQCSLSSMATTLRQEGHAEDRCHKEI